MHSTKECPCEDLFPHLSKINQEERMQSLSVKSLQQTALVTEYGHVTQLKQFGDRIWSCDTAQFVDRIWPCDTAQFGDIIWPCDTAQFGDRIWSCDTAQTVW